MSIRFVRVGLTAYPKYLSVYLNSRLCQFCSEPPASLIAMMSPINLVKSFGTYSGRDLPIDGICGDGVDGARPGIGVS